MTDQQVAVEKQSISEEMYTLRMGKAITTKAMGRWRCVRTEEEGRLPRVQHGKNGCSRRPCKCTYPCVHTYVCIHVT